MTKLVHFLKYKTHNLKLILKKQLVARLASQPFFLYEQNAHILFSAGRHISVDLKAFQILSREILKLGYLKRAIKWCFSEEGVNKHQCSEM